MKAKINIIKGECDYIDEEPLPEYDFSNAKHYHSEEERKKVLIELEPEVARHFHNSKEVNKILKTYIRSMKRKELKHV
jgi:hypothetical protein